MKPLQPIDWHQPGFATRADVINLLRSVALFAEMLAARWFKPVDDRHKRRLFSKVEVLNAVARFENGERPKICRAGATTNGGSGVVTRVCPARSAQFSSQ